MFKDDQVKHVNALYEPKVFSVLAPPVAASGADRLPAFERASIKRVQPRWALTSYTTSTTSTTMVEESGRMFGNVAQTQDNRNLKKKGLCVDRIDGKYDL